MRHALIAMILVGCGTTKANETTTSPSTDAERTRCAAAIKRAATTGQGDETFSAAGQAFNAEVEVVMTDSCVATKWPPHVLACLTNGASSADLRVCPEMMTPVQREDFMERVLVVTKKHEAAQPPATP
jgi:hypothetical protein